MNQQSFIYNFLLSPRYKIWRYVTLIVFFTIVSVNQAIVGYIDIIPLMGNNIYWVVAITILLYMVTVVWVLKLVTKFLLSGKYILFVLSVIACALLFLSIANIMYDSYIEDYDFFSETTIVDNLSAFTIYILCISGVLIPVFLRNWIVSTRNLNELKIKQASSQVEQFKEQINPASFFKILSSSKNFVKTEPDKASSMLMKLSQLLRYQLYDCNREQVLLTSEMSFLRNFLELEKLHSIDFDYTLNADGNINGVFIPPSLLLPYVQGIMNAFDKELNLYIVKIQLYNTDNAVNVTLKTSSVSNKILLKKELLKIRKRLSTLYRGYYSLYVGDVINGETEVVLELNKR